VRPYKIEDVQLAADAPQGATSLKLTSAAKFQNGVFIAVGEGTNDIEIHQIKAIDPATNTVTLDKPLGKAHPSGQWAGTEFVQSIWYPDVALDNIFFHDHVNGIFGWSHGMVGQLLIEPRGSTYHDPKTGQEIDSGAIADIHTNDPLIPGQVDGGFREMALWTIDNHSTVDSSLNLRAEPWSDRGGDPSLLFSSYAHGDPFTPLPKAYPGDPFVIRTINVSQGMQTLHIDGHRISPEPRYADDVAGSPFGASPIDTIHYGISEKYTLALEGGAGGPDHIPGDYLYNDGVERSFKAGAWGILRVLAGSSPDLQPLPGTNQPADGDGLPQQTGGRPPAASGPGDPCPSTATRHDFNVSAVDMPNATDGRKFAFVPSDQVAAVKGGKMPEPLVMHVVAGDCVNVLFKNESSSARASFHLGGLLRDIESSGVNVGFNPEQTVASGGSRVYRFYADRDKLESALISDFGGNEGSRDGLYGAVVVAPKGATFTDPVSGTPTDVGAQVDVHCSPTCSVDGKDVKGYRDFALMFADQDPTIGQSTMPYPISVSGPALVNYRSVGQRPDDASMFSSAVHGDPTTPILRAHAGDPVKVHMVGAPGSEQLHTVSLGGLSWPEDPYIHQSDEVSTRALGPLEKIDAVIVGGAGGPTHQVGDYVYQDRRLAFTEAGMWGLIRVLPSSDTSIKPLGGGPPPPAPAATVALAVNPTAVDFGKATTLSGRLTAGGNPLAAKQVVIKERPVGESAFAPVPNGQSTTGNDGTFTLSGVKPSKNTDYQAEFVGDAAANLQPATSPIKRVNVKVLVSENVSTSSLKLGQSVTISGAVTPSRSGPVKLTIKRGTRTVATRNVSLSNSRYRLTYKPPSAGSYSVIASFAGDADYQGNTSPARSFRVIRQ
ncbi:MAG TPA: Ig-like domain repeat protein, partial [Rubrobacteraceae bacterium]|nr:Ig-like domain repeat protein [Rubrobacteraceae bacterium]